MIKPRVLVSIVNWNGGDAIVDCLATLFDSAFQSFSVVVIDNGSVDDSVARVRERFPSVAILRNKDNAGFAKGHNRGLKLAIDQGFDYAWVLNYDTSIPAPTLGQLVAELDASPTTAMVSPIIRDGTADGGVQFCGGTIDWKSLSFFNWEPAEVAAEARANDQPDLVLWGTALLVRVSALAVMGQFDERYFAYYEDIDLSLAAIRSGFKTKIVGSAHVLHFSNNDPRQRPPYYVYFTTRNRALFWTKHLAVPRRVEFWRKYLAGALLLASSFEQSGDKERANATLLAIWDAIRARGGRFAPERVMPRPIVSLATAHPYLLADILRGNMASILGRAIGRARRTKEVT